MGFYSPPVHLWKKIIILRLILFPSTSYCSRNAVIFQVRFSEGLKGVSSPIPFKIKFISQTTQAIEEHGNCPEFWHPYGDFENPIPEKNPMVAPLKYLSVTVLQVKGLIAQNLKKEKIEFVWSTVLASEQSVKLWTSKTWLSKCSWKRKLFLLWVVCLHFQFEYSK